VCTYASLQTSTSKVAEVLAGVYEPEWTCGVVVDGTLSCLGGS
jgi:hypothetical protein